MASITRYPFATWRPLKEDGRQTTSAKKRLIILHSAAGTSPSLHGFFNNGSDLESHFQGKCDGEVEQYMSLNQRADANRRVNDIAYSWETQNQTRNFDADLFTEAQIDAFIDFCVWAHHNDGIPLRRADGPFGSGIGYHTMWGAPSDWTPVAKTCPGVARKKQFNEIIMPRIEAIARGGAFPLSKPGAKTMDKAQQDWLSMRLSAQDQQLERVVQNLTDLVNAIYGPIRADGTRDEGVIHETKYVRNVLLAEGRDEKLRHILEKFGNPE